MLGQIGLIWRQSTILSYLPKPLFSATPNQILSGHIFLNFTKTYWSKFFRGSMMKRRSPCCLPSFQFWITFQPVSQNQLFKVLEKYFNMRASNQLTKLANVFLFCIFHILHKKRFLWPISRFSRPKWPSDEARVLVSGKISAPRKPNWIFCPIVKIRTKVLPSGGLPGQDSCVSL